MSTEFQNNSPRNRHNTTRNENPEAPRDLEVGDEVLHGDGNHYTVERIIDDTKVILSDGNVAMVSNLEIVKKQKTEDVSHKEVSSTVSSEQPKEKFFTQEPNVYSKDEEE